MAIRKIWAGYADGPACHPLLVEGLVVDAFLPGTILKQTTSGLETTDKLSTVFDSETIVAIEQGANVGALIDTPWVIGETGKAIKARSGELVAVFVTTGTNLTVDGIALSSNGDGTLKIAVTDGSEQILFYSRQVVNVTGADALVFVEKA